MDLENKKTGHPFTAPKGYFEEMESRILSEVSLQHTVKKEAPFVAGDDFFKKLEQEILAKTTGAGQEKPEVFKVAYKKPWTRIYRAAAGILLFFGLGTAYYYYSADQVNIDDLSTEEMVAYLEDQQISSADIASLIEPSAFETKDIIPDDLEINENDIYLENDVKPEKRI